MNNFSPKAPSTSRHHADWLSLVEVSGPFVSLPVLLRVFPQGLDPRDPEQAKALRTAYEEWQDNPTAPGKQRAWVLHVLTSVLGYPINQIAEGQTLPTGLEANMPEMGETLRPDFALVGPVGSDTAGQAQLLIATYTAEQKLDRPTIGKYWKATPATRMMELLHGSGAQLGLVTNGEHWMLVYAPRGETTGYASWYGSLWLDEPITLRAFHSLLGVRRFFGVSTDGTLLALLKESANDQQEVTDQLGYQVREAVEVLVQSFDALDKESNWSLLKGVKPTDLYDSALTIMMRLVFLFSAEERGLLHLGTALYDNNYAVSTLQEQLQEVADRHGEEVLERRFDAWTRLLATFRAVHGGIRHQDLMMQAYGGSLFDPDRYPFLEGRTAGSAWRSMASEPLAVNNRVVLHLLNSLQRLRIKAGGATETRRVSFRALGVENIGHVYEGLLDHTAVRTSEPVLGLKGTRNKEAEVSLATLESLAEQGREKLVEFLKEETGRSLAALRKALDEVSLLDEHKLLVACGQSEMLLARLRPFATLIREDSFERPLVVLDGSIYVTAGTTRRSTGTHYTPPSLTEPIVRHTLEPLVYKGPAEGVPREQWKLKSPKELLDLKVCDMAMGSGAFLVQACRYLAERLTEAWENEERKHPGQVLITPDGKFSEGAPSERLVPEDATERIAIARRVVADRCLYGVDINPMAVEMAKLSLWLVTVDRDRPFNFLDHAFKCGDSLLGITSLIQLENFSLRPGGGKQQVFATLNLWRYIEGAKQKREVLEAMPSDTPEQVAAKATLYAEAEESVDKLNAAADVLVAFELRGLTGKTYEVEREATLDQMMQHWTQGQSALETYACQEIKNRRCLHWALSFPEATSRGFDAFVGNPPFMGGRLIGRAMGEDYPALISLIRNQAVGSPDLCAYFILRAYWLLSGFGALGMIATKTISETGTRSVCLDQLISAGGKIFRANSRQRWPGKASVVVAIVHLSKGKWAGGCKLDENAVQVIDGGLEEKHPQPDPFRLSSMKGRFSQGQDLMGRGFELNPVEREALIANDPSSIDLIVPLYNGQDLNSMATLKPYRWAIYFGNMCEDEARRYSAAFAWVEDKVKPYRDGLTGQIHQDCFWKFWDLRPRLMKEMEANPIILASAVVSKYVSFRRVPTSNIYSQKTKLYYFYEWSDFAILQSNLHQEWAQWRCATLGATTFSYSTSAALETWPMPRATVDVSPLASIGERFHDFRTELMINNQEGLTDIYNRFHDPAETSVDIDLLRSLHVKMDLAVKAAYGWEGLVLDHGFHETKQGIRFTISEAARREVLDRLLALNHQRHAEEEAERAAQPVTATTKRGRKPKDTGNQITLDL